MQKNLFFSRSIIFYFSEPAGQAHMPKFYYKAKDSSGELIFEAREAENKENLAESLLKDGYTLVSANLKEKKKGLNTEIEINFLRRGVPLIERMMFSHHLSMMVDAGLSFDKALLTLKNQTKNKNFKNVISKVKEDVLSGRSFSDALKKHPNVFNELYTSMVKVGEETGNLKEVLNNLAVQMEKEHKLISKVKGAITYPAVILAVMLIIGILMMIMVIPQFSQMFDQLGVELPLPTQILINVGDFLAQYWYSIPLSVAILFFGLKWFKDTKIGKKIIDWYVLKMPIIGSLYKKVTIARSCRTLGSLLKSGVSIVRTLEILSNSLSNNYYKKAINEAAKEIQKGKTLKDCLFPYEKLYSFLMIQMVEVGEKTGKLEEILMKLAEFYEEEVDYTTKNLSSVIEPVLMVIIGIAVGLFAISIIQPMYSMMGAI